MQEKAARWAAERRLDMEREQVTIRLPAELKELIQQKADMMGISFNALAITLLRKALAVE